MLLYLKAGDGDTDTVTTDYRTGFTDMMRMTIAFD